MGIRTAVLMTLALGAAALGCGSPASDVCDAKCECENCSDKNYDRCIVETEAGFDEADTYGCRPEADDYSDCAVRKYRCPGGNFEVGDECATQAKDLDRCVNSSSAIR